MNCYAKNAQEWIVLNGMHTALKVKMQCEFIFKFSVLNR